MDLFLLRHGIAFDGADDIEGAESAQPLTMKGANRVRAGARGLRAMGVSPQKVLTSPWKHATQTALIVREELKLGKRTVLEVDALLPERDPDELWAELRNLGADAVLCVGHTPNLDRQLAALLGLPDAKRLALKRAGGALLQVDLDRPTPSASLIWFVPPKTLRKLGQM